MDDYHCAWKAVTDFKGLSEAYGVLAVKNKTGDFYLRSNCLNRFVGIGCHVSPKDSFHHANEIQYDFFGKNKGIYGYPVFWRFGGSYHFPNNSKLTSQLAVGANEGCKMTNKLEVPVSK